MGRRAPKSMWSLETLGRARLSRYFFMRDFFYSEISAFHGIPNVPDDPDTMIAAGRGLAQNLLDPMVETFGPLAIRSGYRSPRLNQYGNDNKLNCSHNRVNKAQRMWDYVDDDGHIGACVSVVVPWFADQYGDHPNPKRDWRDLAWWVHDHIPYSAIWFFPKLACFNLTWSPAPLRTISSYVAPRGMLLASGDDPSETIAERQDRYADFPPFRAIQYPKTPNTWSPA